jgi:DNA-binding response OmpR family regulator
MHQSMSVKEKILLVEDNVDLRELTYIFLRHRGYHVLHAKSGLEAVKTARAELPDLIVTDVLLRGMDGVEVAKELRKDAKTSHIPILALTGKSFSKDTDYVRTKVFNDFLLKPANLHQLEAKIQRLLKQFGPKT